MNNEELKNHILSFESDISIEQKQYLTFNISKEKFKSFVKQLRYDENLLFDYLFNMTGVDYKDSLGVVYFFTSTKYDHFIVVKTFTSDRDKPEIESVCDIWKTAEFHEREIFDLLGINFTNHNDLRRIFLEDDWKGHPLRKDYVDEINVIER